mmetsp:Transcript_215/g.196  ORF Transcript_215/g.196 Transcript_215/m.196 type:complete len:231 (+) Transcript_215:220-912(+)|eukprot:CAMPEP_0202942786 /NCGR_PEP_ID=MMETSP1395-20130829/3034_1 /ASSEMBLY_ACC=CAM_ASM_000871 /TAXON_ID=5961 /ORGANISM="Blepharisma japonicum, Strain Stock R1072" /LENGTH=230 /DNA_ID=CAMNT_0049639459 /DNA_START=220 /DNA_END=912 /DNA_ORIENTATION=-
MSSDQFQPEENNVKSVKNIKSVSPKTVVTGKKTFDKKEVKPLSSDELKQMFQKYRKNDDNKSENVNSSDRQQIDAVKPEKERSSEQSPANRGRKQESKSPQKPEIIKKKQTIEEKKEAPVKKQTIKENKSESETVEDNKIQPASRKQTIKEDGAIEEKKSQPSSRKPTVKEPDQKDGIEENKEPPAKQPTLKKEESKTEEIQEGLIKQQTLKKEDIGSSEIKEDIDASGS